MPTIRSSGTAGILGNPEASYDARVYIGIDPGVSGGIAAIGPGGLTTYKIPDNEEGLWEIIASFDLKHSVAVIELVTGYVAGGRAPASRMVRLVKSYWGARMAMVGCGISFQAKTARAWQSEFVEPKEKGAKSSQHKNDLKAAATFLFPSERVTLATADAILIAEYCRRLHNNELVCDTKPKISKKTSRKVKRKCKRKI